MRTLVGTMVSAVMIFAGCAAQQKGDSAKVVMHADVEVTSDPGRGLGGVVLAVAEQRVATTDASGRARVTLEGLEGDSVLLAVQCPTGFEAAAPLRVAFRRLSSGSPAPRFEARCAPIQRTVVVGVRVENGPNVPIYRLGKRVGETDSAGAAHVVLQVKANEQVSLTLATTERTPTLRPENPTLTFIAKDRDDFVMLQQRFEPERVVVRARPRQPAPERI